MNPQVKKGDKIILKRSTQGYQGWEGKILEVSTSTTNFAIGNITAKQPDKPNAGSIPIYYAHDEFVLADRKSQAEYLKEKLVSMSKEITDMEAEIERLEKFDTEEEYVAYKIDKLLKAKGVKAKAAVLRTLKETHYL